MKYRKPIIPCSSQCMSVLGRVTNLFFCRPSRNSADGGRLAERDSVSTDVFLRAMLGKGFRGPDEGLNDLLSDPFNTIVVREELSGSQIVSASQATAKSAGLIIQLQPALYDCLRRRLGFVLASECLHESSLPSLQSAMPEELLTALLMSASNRRRMGRWAARNAGLALPWLSEDQQGGLVDISDCLSDLLSQPGFRALVSVGGADGLGRGKSNLLRLLFPEHFRGAPAIRNGGRGVDVRLPFSVSKGGKLGAGWDETVLIDVNGLTGKNESVTTIVKNSSVALIHCFPGDSADEILSLATLSKKFLVLFRDHSETAQSKVFKKLESFLTKEKFPGFLGVLPVPNLSPTSPSAPPSALAKTIKAFLAPALAVTPAPCLEVFKGASNQATHSRLDSELLTLLEAARLAVGGVGGLRSAIFPFSALQAKQLGLSRKERNLREEGGSDSLASLAAIHQQLGSIRAEISDLSKVRVSAVVGWFCQVFLLKKAGNFSLYALARVLDDWKAPLLEPLLKERRFLLDSGSSADNESRLVAVNKAMDELELSVDLFWTELEVLVAYYGQDAPHLLPVPKELFFKRYAEMVAGDGFPLQLLKGSPLHLADPACLKGVLSQLGSNNQKVLVVSVIGAQSSAKSTLLNFLFGCEFETRSGRCTKGLYASFAKLADGRILVVLDSEGLLSVEAAQEHSEYGGAEVFDGQMTLLAMACSHLVLINHKGEISRQLQDLLEVCMFAMKHLKVANFQPLVSFVLRDQHDRSPSVHEDTLRHMRRHLADCASRLGIKLEEILRLDASSIHLLPSAFSTERAAGGGEVEVLNDLFGGEILKVRNALLDKLSGEKPFENLSQWVSHAAVVWETLVQFGHNLLHYKTIQEIELKREVNNLATDLIRETLEQRFKPKAGEIIANYNSQLATARLADLDALDIEVTGSLTNLKSQESAKLIEAFEKSTTEKRFTETIKQPERERLTPALDFAHDNQLYTWKLLLRQARDGQQAQGLWTHFCDAMERMVGSEGRAVTEEEARAMFRKEWAAYESQCRDRLDGVKRDRAGIAYEVSVVFNHALAKVSREREDFAILKPVGVVMGDGLGTLLTESEDEWRSKYVKFDNLDARNDMVKKAIGKDLRVIRGLVEELVSLLESDVTRSTGVNESCAIDWLRKSHDLVTSEADRRIRSVEVRRPQLLAALHMQLRHSAVAQAWAIEENKHKAQLELLASQKAELESHLVVMARSNASDVERARAFADRYHSQLLQWLDFVVTSFAAEVRSIVLTEMPDTAKAHERAFQQSFGARNWQDVLEYCLDVNAYLEKLFLLLFHRRQLAVVAARQPQLETRVAEMYQAIKEAVIDWSKEQTENKLEGLHLYLSGIAGSEDTPLKAVVSVFPQTMNFEVKDCKIFATTFSTALSELFGNVFPGSVEMRVSKCLAEQSVEAWALLKGCSARCPLCGSKCDKLGEHADHSCGHHLFPAFHGWMDRQSGKPSLSLCQSEEVHQGTYQCRDGSWRPLKEYLEDSHRSWCPFPTGFADNQKDDENILKAAWVNTRKALEKYFKPMKAVNPPEWECYLEEGRALVETDLDKAKKVIKALRAKKWSPKDGVIA